MFGLLLLGFFVYFCRVQGIDDFRTFPINIEDYMKNFKTERPIIALTTMYTGNKSLVQSFHRENTYYVGASYVKLIEMAGGRVVPVFNRLDDKELYTILNSVNGALVGGGDADVDDSGYSAIARKIVKYAMKKNDEGEHWPVFGICRGAQMLQAVVTERLDLVETDSKNYTLPLKFYPGFKKGRLFGFAPKSVIETLRTKPITMNAHVHGIAPKYFWSDPNLKSFYRILSTNVDRKGVEFISTYEGRKYPIYGFQWHPEKVLFVHNPNLVIDHSLRGIQVSQYIANFMVSEAKLNGNKFFSVEEERRHLIYNWNPVYVGDIREDTPYEQMYLIQVKGIARKHPQAKELSKEDKAFVDMISKANL